MYAHAHFPSIIISERKDNIVAVEPTGGEAIEADQRRGVTGIAEWVHDEKVSIDGYLDAIANLRREMIFGEPQRILKSLKY
jgi:hypothetical protein